MENEMEMPARQEGGDVTKLAQAAGDALSKFSEALNASQAVTDADREQMAGVMEGFINLVEKNLGQAAPGEDLPAEEPIPEKGVVSAEAGMKGVPMDPRQGRM